MNLDQLCCSSMGGRRRMGVCDRFVNRLMQFQLAHHNMVSKPAISHCGE